MDNEIVRMGVAADAGNTDGIYVLLQQDPYVLERIDGLPFAQTPLHIAAGKIVAEQDIDGQERYAKFAFEMMILKPSFARKLNPADGYSPMHIAVVRGRTTVVQKLLRFDKDLARVKGRSGLTPLHLAAEKGCKIILDVLLKACPECITDVEVNGLNASHLAADHNMFEALQFMAHWIRKSTHKDGMAWEKGVINGKDRRGNTVLHIAASKNNPQMWELLLKFNVHKNSINLDGETALDIAQGHNLSVDVLLRNKCQRASANPSGSALAQSPRSQDISWWKKLDWYMFHLHSSFSNDPSRSALLVVYVLILSSTYNACLNPPGGFRQGNFTLENNIPSLNISSFVGYSNLEPLSLILFYLLNTTTFIMTVIAVLILLGRELSAFGLLAPIAFLIASYMFTILTINSNIYLYLGVTFISSIFAYGVIVLAATIWRRKIYNMR